MAKEARRGTDIGREKEGKGKERRRRKRDTGFTDRQRLAAGRTGSRPASQASRSERPSWVSAPTDVCIVVLYICSVHIIRASSSVCATRRCPASV